MKPHKKSDKKLTETLNRLYGHLDSKYIANEAAEVSQKPFEQSGWSPGGHTTGQDMYINW